MKTLFKLLGGLLGLIVVAALLVIAAVALFVDPNDYREEISSAVQSQTGRELIIKGDLSLGLLPCCAIALGETSLSNPAGFEQASFAQVESARLGLQLWPLLSRQELLLDELTLTGLKVNLLRRADGQANWEFSGEENRDADSTEAADTDESGSGLSALSLGGINISDAELTLRDVPAGTDLRVENFSLVTGELAAGEPFDFETALRFIDAAADTRADLKLSAEAIIDDESARIALTDIDGSIVGEGADTGRFDLALTAPSATLDLSGDIQASAEQLAADINLNGGPLGTDGELLASVSSPRLDYNAAGNGSATLGEPKLDLQLKSGDLPGGSAAGKFQLGVLTLSPDSGQVTLKALQGDLTLAGAQLDITADGQLGEKKTDLAGAFVLAPLSPRELLAELGEPVPDTADPEVLKNFSAQGNWRLGTDQLKLDKLVAQLDETRLNGELAAANFDQPRLSFKLAADQLNLDRYLAPESEDTKKDSGAANADSDTDLELLRELDLTGTLQVGSLTVANLKIQNLDARLVARDGVIKLDPASANLYGGTYKGAVSVDVSGPEMRLALDQTLDNVQSEGLLTDFAEVDQLQGLLVARINAAGSGNNQAELLRNLQGDLSFDLVDGIYQGMDVWQEIRRARALLRREQPPAREGLKQTVINSLTVRGRLQDGVLRSQRMQAEIPFLRLTGDGSVDVLAQELDYRFKANVFETPSFADGESYDDLTGLTIPVTISGAADDPKIGVDIAALATNVAVQKATDKLFDRLGLGKKEPAPEAGEGGDTSQQAVPDAEQQEQEPEDARDALRRGLGDLLKR